MDYEVEGVKTRENLKKGCGMSVVSNNETRRMLWNIVKGGN